MQVLLGSEQILRQPCPQLLRMQGDQQLSPPKLPQIVAQNQVRERSPQSLDELLHNEEGAAMLGVPQILRFQILFVFAVGR